MVRVQTKTRLTDFSISNDFVKKIIFPSDVMPKPYYFVLSSIALKSRPCSMSMHNSENANLFFTAGGCERLAAFAKSKTLIKDMSNSAKNWDFNFTSIIMTFCLNSFYIKLKLPVFNCFVKLFIFMLIETILFSVNGATVLIFWRRKKLRRKSYFTSKFGEVYSYVFHSLANIFNQIS